MDSTPTVRAILSGRKLGLAFGGGGAKGAYEVGCLKALEEAGLLSSLYAVSGSSVGALNAVLAATGGVAKAKQIWAEVTAHQVYRRSWLQFVTATIARVVSYGLLFLGSLLEFLTVLLLGAPLFGLFTFIGGMLFLYLGFKLRKFLNTRFTLLSDHPLRNLIRRSVSLDEIRSRGIPTSICVARNRRVWDVYTENQGLLRDTYPFVGYDWIKKGRKWREFWFEHVILAAEKKARSLGTTCVAPTQQTPVPTYLDALTVDDEQFYAYLIQSCALPEIFPARKLDQHNYYIDGGIADNLPILPLLNSGCDVVLAITLDATMTFDLALSHVYRIAALLFWLNLDEQVAWQVFREWARSLSKTLTPPLPTVSPDNLILLRPSKSLGDIRTGTLNFRPEKLRSSMDLGYRDTLALLNEHAHDNTHTRPNTNC